MEDFERMMEEIRILEEDLRRHKMRRAGCIEPLYNIVESEDEIRVSIDLPGVEKEDIKLNLQEDELIVEGVCKKETPSVRRLTGGGPLYYSIRISLPTKVDEESAKARYINGILEIVLVKWKHGRSIRVE